ncbi:hypothetical protein D3C85_1589240 [compost metagenome]
MAAAMSSMRLARMARVRRPWWRQIRIKPGRSIAPSSAGSLSSASTSGVLLKKFGAWATLAASWRSRASRSLRASSSTVMASMLPLSWNTEAVSGVWFGLMVCIDDLLREKCPDL